MTITALPTPPSPSDSPAVFNSKAFDLLGALPTFVAEANGLEAENAAAASAAATAAANAALASKLDAASPSYTGTLTGGTGVVNLGSGQFVKDAAGNVGVGVSVTPSAWAAGHRVVEFGSVCNSVASLSGGDFNIANNAFLGGSGWVYKLSAGATRFQQDFGVSRWLIDSGTKTAGAACNFTTAMTLDASGNLLVGGASLLAAEKLSAQTAASSGQVAYLYASNASYTGTAQAISTVRAATTSFSFATYYAAGVVQYQVLGNGNVQNTNNSYGAISDLKLKENITDASPKLAKLMQVRIVNYTLKADPDKTKLIGVIAQELEQISPNLIEETPDYEEVKKTREVEVPAIEAVLDDEGNEVTPAVKATTRTEEYTERVPTGTVTKSVKYSVFVPMLIKGMQEQQAQIEAMQAQIDTQNHALQLLTARLEALESK